MIEAECLCGAVRYRIDGALKNARSCHCSRGREAFTGAASAYTELESQQSFAWTIGRENVRRYSSQIDWGLGFCKTCGSTMCGYIKNSVHGVKPGCVNGDPGVKIGAHIIVGSRAP